MSRDEGLIFQLQPCSRLKRPLSPSSGFMAPREHILVAFDLIKLRHKVSNLSSRVWGEIRTNYPNWSSRARARAVRLTSPTDTMDDLFLLFSFRPSQT